MANPFPFTAGQVLTAAELNGIGSYTAYTPTFTNVTTGNGTSTFFYTQIQNFVHVIGRFVFGSTSSISGTPVMTLPINRNTSDIQVIGTGALGDAGVATFMLFPVSNAINTVILFSAAQPVADVRESGLSATDPFTWGTNDFIQVNLYYRAA